MTKSKTALVIGASGGIGQAVVEELVSAGFEVVISARNKEKLETLASSLPENTVTIIPANISEKDSIEKLFLEIENKLENPVGVVVVAAGGWAPNTFENDLTSFEDNFTQMVEQNLTGPALALFAGAKYLKKQGGGILVNVSSHAARKSLAGNLGYGPTKSGIHWFTQLLNNEAGETVRVTDIQPAVVNTGSMTKQLGECSHKAIQPEDIGKVVVLLTQLSLHTTVSQIHLDANYEF
ncbi:SDR family oxidoreductase [Candidatus Kaiserbacteria bacterium]|nr:SDR family oxidoreductase [Candidatus Kaiserbacteria bacterium]